MKPKEKAEYLVKKYIPLLPFYSEKDNKNKAIQCALIAVDEILNLELWNNFNEEFYRYWEEVKEHLKNM